MIEISIEYLEKGKKEPQKTILTPEEYFDPIEDGETYEKDAIPKFNHVIKYINIEGSKLIWSKLILKGTSEDKIINTRYYHDGETWITHRKDEDGYEEIIHNTLIDVKTSHIIRTHKDSDGNWIVNLNSMIYEQADGSEIEVRYDAETKCG